MSTLTPCPHPSICNVSGHYPDKGALEACRRRGQMVRSGGGTSSVSLAGGERLDPGTTRYLDVYATVEATGGSASEDTYQISFESAVSDFTLELEHRQPIGQMTPDARALVQHLVSTAHPQASELLGEDFAGVQAELGVGGSTVKDPMSLENDFESEKAIRNLMDHHGLNDWSIKWTTSESKAGQCDESKKRLLFSEFLFASGRNEVNRDTVLHEIAHAKVGPGHMHDDTWKAMAIKVGAKPKATETTRVTREEYDRMNATKAWHAVCPSGQHKTYSRTQPKHISLCQFCQKPSDERLMSWTKKGQTVDMSADYQKQEWAFKVRAGLIESTDEEMFLAKLTPLGKQLYG